MAEPVPVSVIIPSHDGRTWLARCLPGIGAGSRVDHEVVVADNGSRDGTAEWLALAFPGVRVVCRTEGLGFAAAANLGARAAGGRVLVFLNNDTEPQAGWLDALVTPVLDDPDHVVTTARLVRLDDPAIVDSAGDGYAWWGAAFKRGAGDRADHHDAPSEAFSPCGAACAIARDRFLALGGFDEAFGSVCEDVDLGYRVRLAGGRCLYVPHAVVRHAGSATLGIEAPGPIRLGQRNLEWTWVANTPWPLLLAQAPLHLAYEVLAAAFFARRGRFGAFVRGKREALAGWRQVIDKRRRAQRLRTVSSRRLLSAMTPPPLLGKWREKRAIASRRQA